MFVLLDGLTRALAVKPVETIIAAGLVVASLAVIGNAFMQHGRHPAPMMATRGRDTSAMDRLAAEAASVPASDPLIRAIQSALARRGFYRGEPDGLNGPLTEQAIRDFEAATGRTPTARPSEALLRAIEAADPSVRVQPLPPRPPSRQESAAQPDMTVPVALSAMVGVESAVAAPVPAETPAIAPSTAAAPAKVIAELQASLANLGYPPGRTDGVLDEATRDAIRHFELDHGLELTGEVYDRLIERVTLAETGFAR